MSILAVLDDNEMYFTIVGIINSTQKLFRSLFKYTTGQSLADYLWDNRNNAHALPDVLFLDIHTSAVGGWEFIENYKKLRPNLCKQTKVYVVAVMITPKDLQLAKAYDFIEECIRKPILTDKMVSIFLNSK